MIDQQVTPTLGDRLRQVADWLDQHPAAQPHQIETWGDAIVVQDYSCHTREDLAARVKALGGRWDKLDEVESLFEVVRDICPGVRYRIATWRDAVCERVVVGTTTVSEPDPAAVAALPHVEREVEQVEWRCPPSILAQVA